LVLVVVASELVVVDLLLQKGMLVTFIQLLQVFPLQHIFVRMVVAAATRVPLLSEWAVLVVECTIMMELEVEQEILHHILHHKVIQAVLLPEQ
jgi:hypothetical protein